MERQILNLESKFKDGNYYDILQSYKALYFRLSSQKKYKETISLLESGCNKFLEFQQWNCAAELAKLFVETYKNFNTQFSDETKTPIIKIFKGFKTNDCQGKINFMRDAIEWSSKNGGDKKGSPEFHTLLAQSLTEEGDFIDAQKHFIFGNSPSDFNRMLKEWTSEVDEEEKDLYITRAIFGYLCVKKLSDAQELFKLFTEGIEEYSPLLNYDRFLLLTLERDALPLFNILKQKYDRSLRRDPQFFKYLEQIANVFYKVPVSSGGGLGGMLSSLLGGFGGMSSPLMSMDIDSNSNNNTTTTSNITPMDDEMD